MYKLSTSIEGEEEGYHILSASEIANIVLSHPTEIVWDTVYVASTQVGDFEILSTDSTHPPISHTRMKPVSPEEFDSLFDDTGKLAIDPIEFRKRICLGGCEQVIRKRVFKYLMGCYALDSTTIDRTVHETKHRMIYANLKKEWSSSMAPGSFLTDVKNSIEKDVVRTDQKIAFFKAGESDCISKALEKNKNLVQLRNILMTWTTSSPFGKHLGFVQGMSDLLAPFLFLMQDESDAFWCFTFMMERLKSNFDFDGIGIKKQLEYLKKLISILDPVLYAHLDRLNCLDMYCSFRHILVLFKREFDFADIFPLWEFIFSDYYTPDMHLFVAACMLMLNKSILQIETQEDVLKACLSCRFDVKLVISESQNLFIRFRDLVQQRGISSNFWTLDAVFDAL